MAMLTVHYFISFICGSFHLLVDPALELIRITEKLLQVEGIGQLGPAIHGSLMKGIATAQQLEDKDLVNLQLLPPQRYPANKATHVLEGHPCRERMAHEEPRNLQHLGE